MDHQQVLEHYRRITGVQLAPGQDRKSQIAQIVEGLKASTPPLSDFDLYILEQESIPDEGMAALWLMNDRQELTFGFKFAGTIGQKTHFIANLTSDRRNVSRRVIELEGQGKTGAEICQVLRNEGFSFNQVLSTLRRRGYEVDCPAEKDFPTMTVSREKRTLYWFQRVWMEEKADMTIEEVPWMLERLEHVQALSLPIRPVVFTDFEMHEVPESQTE